VVIVYSITGPKLSPCVFFVSHTKKTLVRAVAGGDATVRWREHTPNMGEGGPAGPV